MRGCKYLVVRRDGTLPQWPYFVLGGADPYAREALWAYADAIETQQGDKEYADSVRQLAEDFENWRIDNVTGDPIAPPHRKDEPSVIDAMEQPGGSVVLAPISPQEPRPQPFLTTLGEYSKLLKVYETLARLPEGKHLVTVEAEQGQTLIEPMNGHVFVENGKRITIVPNGLDGPVRVRGNLFPKKD